MAFKPQTHVIITASPFYGHVRPLRSIAKRLAALKYPVTFVTGTFFRDFIKQIPGVTFAPLHGKADFDPDRLDEQFPGLTDHKGLEQVFFYQEEIFFGTIQGQFDAVQEVLKKHDGERNVFVTDAAGFTGTMPMSLGTPLTASRAPIVGIGHMPLVIHSVDSPPFGSGMPSQGREHNIAMNASVTKIFSRTMDKIDQLFEPFQCSEKFPRHSPTDYTVLLPDIYCQMTVPSMEPIRSDLPSKVRFVGTINGGNDRRDFSTPDWFKDFVTNSTSQDPLILVTSGSLIGLSASDLILPTIEACKVIPGVRLLICGVHVPQPASLELPENMKWAKWIPFEDALPHTTLMISSGGYGGINQAFAAGVPMIVAGTSEDKTETTMRAEGTGAAINLKTQTPSVEQLKNAIQAIIRPGLGYREKALGLKKEYEECDAVGSIVQAVEELAGNFYD